MLECILSVNKNVKTEKPESNFSRKIQKEHQEQGGEM